MLRNAVCSLICLSNCGDALHPSLQVFNHVVMFSIFPVVRKKIRKRRLFKKVQAFREEKVLRCLLGVFWYAESDNQCWQAEKWRLHYLICIFPRWPPN